MRSIRAVVLVLAPLLAAACSGGAEETAEKAAPVVATAQTPEAYIEKSAQMRREGKPKEANDTALKAYMLAREGPRINERIEIAKTNAATGDVKDRMGAINEIKQIEREIRADASLKLDEVTIAEVYALIGDTEAVFRWLGRAVENKSPKLADLANNPEFESVKADPRWASFVTK